MPCLFGSAGLPARAGAGRDTRSGSGADHWRLSDEPGAGLYRRCANLDTPAACNWLFPEHNAGEFCVACSLNRTIPDLSIVENGERWRKVETAKRRLVAQLISSGCKSSPRALTKRRAAFDFVGVDLEGKLPTTGHANGLITLNIEEADDAHREAMRVQMHEPYRTLLGHFRHEVGHYYWDRLIAETRWQEGYRNLFGDERASYADALDHHYKNGAPDNWQESSVSAYATMHPWEDWAETRAHYLHMMDAVDTALGFGMSARDMELDYQPFPLDVLYDPQHPGGPAFLSFVNALDRTGQHAQRTVTQHGSAGFLPVRAATCSDCQTALHPSGDSGCRRQG